MPYTLNAITRLYYEIHGTGTPLVLISGLGGDLEFWRGSIEKLQGRFQVILFDNRGIGRSDMPDIPYSMEMLADDLAGLLDEVGVESAHVLGFSMGGTVAQAFALKYPHRLRRLILAATFAKMGRQAELFLDAVLSVYETGATPAQMYFLILPWLFSPACLDTPESAAFLQFDENDPLLQPLHAFRRQYQAQKAFDSQADLARIQHPTLILAGDRDALVTVEDAQKLYEGIPQARLEILSGAGHLFNVEQENLFHQYVIDFFISES